MKVSQGALRRCIVLRESSRLPLAQEDSPLIVRLGVYHASRDRTTSLSDEVSFQCTAMCWFSFSACIECCN